MVRNIWSTQNGLFVEGESLYVFMLWVCVCCSVLFCSKKKNKKRDEQGKGSDQNVYKVQF